MEYGDVSFKNIESSFDDFISFPLNIYKPNFRSPFSQKNSAQFLRSRERATSPIANEFQRLQIIDLRERVAYKTVRQSRKN